MSGSASSDQRSSRAWGMSGQASPVCGEALDPRRVILFAIPLWNRAFVTGPRLVIWPARAAAKDFSTAPLADQAVFVHELTHVWQAQNGVNLILGKLRAGDSVQSYA